MNVDTAPEVAPDGEPEEAPARRWRVFGLPVPVVAAGALGLVMLLLIVLLATRDPASDRQTDSPLLGRVAPRIEGTSVLTGRPFDSTTYDGRWLVVNFFATWCVPCVKEHPELIAFQEAQREAGQANVISVVFEDDQTSIERFFDRNGGDWPVVLAGSTVIADWGVQGVPESFVVDPSGTVRYRLIGGVTAAGLTELVGG
jgi:cytochrome c biogenesis protein CcmG, thiol:disulfide interchange protein DsbE